MSVENNFTITREGAPAELGKRFVCGVAIEQREVKDGKTIVSITYKSGEVKLPGGEVINAGCGTEFLVTKASSSIIECCGKPAVLQKPKPLPSSD